MTDLPQAAGSVTPVGDWLRQRYPPNPGATHYFGAGGDPGCCAGPHPICTYDAGFREGATAERERIRQLAKQHAATYEPCDCPECQKDWHPLPFADLLEPTSIKGEES